VTGNPYHGIFVLDELIANAPTLDELYKIRNKVVENMKYSLKTKQMIYRWMYDREQQLYGRKEKL
jgi:hypothetical protein